MKALQLALTVPGLALLIPGAQAQSNVRVRGTIAAVTGDSLAARSRDGRDLKLEMPADAPIARAVPAARVHLVVGEYVFIGARLAPEGTLRAPRVQVSKDGARPPQ
jgi:hypothetical protein